MESVQLQPMFVQRWGVSQPHLKLSVLTDALTKVLGHLYNHFKPQVVSVMCPLKLPVQRLAVGTDDGNSKHVTPPVVTTRVQLSTFLTFYLPPEWLSTLTELRLTLDNVEELLDGKSCGSVQAQVATSKGPVSVRVDMYGGKDMTLPPPSPADSDSDEETNSVYSMVRTKRCVSVDLLSSVRGRHLPDSLLAVQLLPDSDQAWIFTTAYLTLRRLVPTPNGIPSEEPPSYAEVSGLGPDLSQPVITKRLLTRTKPAFTPSITHL